MVQLKQTVLFSTIPKEQTECNKKTELLSIVQGHFGWVEIGKELIPYIIRSGEMYVSDRMVKLKLFFHFKIFFVDEIGDSLPIKQLCVTQKRVL